MYEGIFHELLILKFEIYNSFDPKK